METERGEPLARIYAVVECPWEGPAFLAGLPPQPWPRFVSPSAASSDHEVALVVAQLVQYGHSRGRPQSFDDLVARFPRVTPGGLAVDDGTTTVHPSCCCGLEAWRDWYKLLSDGQSPWLGHDPSPWVEKRDDDFLVWSDGGRAGSIAEPQEIRLSRQQLADALEGVDRDLRAFAGRLQEWTALVSPAHAQSIADGFRKLAKVS